jgi:hypothetical protein
VKEAYDAGTETLAHFDAATNRTHDATDHYFDVMRQALG